MGIAISSVLVKQITDHAASSGDEVCGLVFGDGSGEGDQEAAIARITAVAPCANVAPDPARRFEIDPVALIAAHRAARGGGARVIGHYHSHPTGSPVPSPRDAADAVEEGQLWLIVGAGRVRAWRSRAGGAIEGRFEAVTLDVVD